MNAGFFPVQAQCEEKYLKKIGTAKQKTSAELGDFFLFI